MTLSVTVRRTLPFLAKDWFWEMNAFLNFTFCDAKLTIVISVSSTSFSNF